MEELGIALMPKFNIMAPADKVKAISEHRACDAICVSNTVHWGDLPQRINWKGLFGSDVSPLAEFGGGALSGWPLLPLVIEWTAIARAYGLKKPLNVGGGILSPKNLKPLCDVGASSVFVGSVATLRPWMIPKIVEKTRDLF
jgi:dihydroorotate dehydrogenase